MTELDKKFSLDLGLCQECDGRCCHGSPGIWVDPVRFFGIFFQGQKLTLEQLRERLPELGLVLWEKSGVPIPAPRSVVSGCAFQRADGCRFSIAERPCQCLALIPVIETLEQPQGCLCKLPDDYSRKAGEQRWKNYWQTI